MKCLGAILTMAMAIVCVILSEFLSKEAAEIGMNILGFMFGACGAGMMFMYLTDY